MRKLIFFLLFAIVYCLMPFGAQAQERNTITVSPQLIQIDLSKDNPEAEYTYTNNTNQTIELTLSMQDVKELEDRGIPGLLDPNESRSYEYGLSSWATFSNKNLVISPGESKTVTVYVDKTQLSLGGHYGSVLAEIQQVTPQKTVKLRAIISSLLFVRAGGQYNKEKAKIQGIDVIQEYFQFPNSVLFRFQNTGNVDVTPYGVMTIKDPLGRQVARSVINEDSLITLPDSVRKYSVFTKPTTLSLIPGIYTVELSVNYGKSKTVTFYSTTFFTVGALNLYGIGAIILFLLTIVISVRMKKKHSRQSD